MNTTIQVRVEALVRIGKKLNANLAEPDAIFEQVMISARNSNGWFTRESLVLSLKGLVKMLEKRSLEDFISGYDLEKTPAKRIGLIMAGNIPAAGFHDMLCVFLTGNIAVCRLSSDDNIYMRYLAELVGMEVPGTIEIVQGKLPDVDAVIATGSNNTSRYFEYYFKKYPHIIRRNRNSVAVLTGNESGEELKSLGFDIFSFFGLGCRNVSIIYVPAGYDFNNFFPHLIPYSEVVSNNKYGNNYDYNRAMLLMKQVPFLDNNFVIIREDERLQSPISILHYSFYNEASKLILDLMDQKENIQCFVAGKDQFKGLEGIRPVIDFGQAQFPAINDFADGVDSIRFLNSF